MKVKGKRRSNCIIVIVFLAGLCLLMYPFVSNYWNSIHQTQAIADYYTAVSDSGEAEKEKMWEDAVIFNKNLAAMSPQPFSMTEDERAEYERLLDITGTGIMGYVEIPSINVSLPIYHGVEETVLQIALGHIEGSSLPTGGESTHCVVSGHRGLPSAKLFSDLDKLAEGDVFVLNVLDETLTYEIDQIRIVEPEEIEELRIVPGEDYCTLVTCTPYGINTHRMLVRGHRIENIEDYINVSADAVQADTLLVALFIAIPVLVILFVIMLIKTRKRKVV